MLKPILTAVVAASFLAAGAQAQEPAPVAVPTSPAPTVAAPAPAVAPAAPNQVIYSPRLPSAAELANAAAAQGVNVERIDQTNTQITVTYKYSNGQVNTVAYQLLPTASAPAPQQTVVQTAPAPTVVYTQPPRVVYYEEPVYYPRYYYPYYPPVSLSFGFGYRHYGGGGFHHRHR